ncbi:hypothetical protein PINS_up004878 [Pythium insidiosum]|nr:hypothetical protein PINS_up004878 [Pythium insidiosum]
MSYEDEDDDAKSTRATFRPAPSQRRAHSLIYDATASGKSPHDFLKSLLAHAAVEFAPHPAVLVRLYDFQFGVLGLSIMHLVQLDNTEKMAWVMATKEKGTKVNMQNFSPAVDLPPLSTCLTLQLIRKALSGLQVFCEAFGSRTTCKLVQNLQDTVQKMTELSLWDADDLKFLVYWIDSMLERYSTATLDDTRSGANTRLHVVNQVNTHEPELRRLNDLVTTKKMEWILRQRASWSTSAPRPVGVPANAARYGPSRPASHAHVHDEARRRPTPAPTTGSQVPPHIRSLIPRHAGRSLCIRYLSLLGCRGLEGNPAECIFPTSRCHLIPDAPLPGPLADYIVSEFQGLRQGVRRE